MPTWVLTAVVCGLLVVLAMAWSSLAAAHDDMRRRVAAVRLGRGEVDRFVELLDLDEEDVDAQFQRHRRRQGD